MLELLGGVADDFAALAAFLGLGALVGFVLRQTKLVALDSARGHSIYGGVMLLTGIAAGAFAAVVAATIALDWGGARSLSPTWPIGVVIALIFGAAGLIFVRGWLRTRWIWDSEGVAYIEGRRVTRLSWSEIATFDPGRVAGAGREICWSRYTIGYEVINEALRKYRPDLATHE